MSEIEIAKEEPLTIGEVRTLLEKIEKRDKELSEKATKTKEYINKITKYTEKDVKDIKEKFEEIGITKLKPRHITKIIDIVPRDPESVKALFSSEPITLKPEELIKIIECFH